MNPSWLEWAADRLDLDDPDLSLRAAAFVAESNAIEGILDRGRLASDLAAHQVLWDADTIAVADLVRLVAQLQPGARLREQAGLDVRVGPHVPPRGGPAIPIALGALLEEVNGSPPKDPWAAHVAYETLHPFTDGNGRSGRALWAWMMRRAGHDPFALPFLHAAYYQALDASRA